MDPQYQELLQKWADAFNKAYIGTQIFYWVLLALMVTCIIYLWVGILRRRR
jgi:type VI protein secretion system component VasF